VNPQVATPSRASAENCPACGCHLDLLTDSGCPYCGWHEAPNRMDVVPARPVGFFVSKARSPWSIWGERVLTFGTFAVVGFATFSLIVSLIRLVVGAIPR